MRRSSSWIAACLAFGLCRMPVAWAEDEPVTPPRGQDPSVCAKVTASARYEGYGYTHVVELHNTCAKRVVCKVWTDVDPEPKQTLRAMPGERDSFVTRRGSPSRAVQAGSECKYEQ
jgi:hypothetical protein